MAILVQDTFNRANTTGSVVVGDVIGWGTASDGNTWTANAGNGNLVYSISNVRGRAIGSSANSVVTLSSNAYGTCEALALISGDVGSGGGSLGVVLRASDTTNQASFYACYFNPGTSILVLALFSTGLLDTDHTALAKNTSSSFQTNTQYWVRFRATGSTLQGRAWQYGTTEPTSWQVTATDSTLSSGMGGLYISNQTNYANAYIQNFQVNDTVALTATNKDLKSRLRLLQRQTKDLSTRLLLQVGTTIRKDAATRLRLAPLSFKDVKARIRLRTQVQDNLRTRLRLKASTGFGVNLITFSPGDIIFAEDVNANFSALNNASIFTGSLAHLVSDNGRLKSVSGGSLLIGGMMGTNALGDRIDVLSVTGSLILGAGQTTTAQASEGVSGSGFAFQVGGTSVGTIATNGFAAAGAKADNVITLQTGSLFRTADFLGRNFGTYNHGLGDSPDWGYGTYLVPTFHQIVLSSRTPTTVSVTGSSGALGSFIVWMIKYT